jgi:hypothetical protein
MMKWRGRGAVRGGGEDQRFNFGMAEISARKVLFTCSDDLNTDVTHRPEGLGRKQA